MFGWLIGLKTKLIAFGALVFAVIAALLFERHTGKVEGQQIAAGKAATETLKAIQERNRIVEQVHNAKAGAAQVELSKRFNR